jgi:hypothetical protein
MHESLFGSAPPMWTGSPTPGFGWPAPGPLSAAGRTGPAAGFNSPQFPQTGATVAGMPLPQAPNGFSPELFPAQTPFATSGAFPTFVNPEVAAAIYGIPGLLAAVAIRRGQPMGPTNDQECEDFLYDALELIPGTSEVEVRCDNGRATLTGSVQHKRLKRDLGEIAWTIPALNDVQNNITIATKRRSRAGGRETESQTSASGRKQG